MKHDTTEMALATFIVFFLGMLLGMFLVDHFTYMPVEKEAIKRGYAEYRSTNTTEQTTTKFTWK